MTVIKLPYKINAGWGVFVALIRAGEDEHGNFDERVADLEIGVARIAADNVKMIGNMPCVPIEGWDDKWGWDDMWIPVENFRQYDEQSYDDSHDARSWWFATEQEAREHAKTVAEQWANPLPWQNFIQTN